MSVQPPETPTPAAAPPRLSDRLITVLGLVIFAAGLVVARALKLPPDAKGDHELAGDLGDILKSFGVVIASIGGALPVPGLLKRLVGAGGGKVLLALIAGGVLAAGSVLPGCGSTYQAERRAVVDWTPGPPCHLEVRLDDDTRPVVTVDAPEACEPPPVKCPATIPPESAAEPN